MNEDVTIYAHKNQRIANMFTTTMSHAMECLAKAYFKNHVFKTIGIVGKVVDFITQKCNNGQRR